MEQTGDGADAELREKGRAFPAPFDDKGLLTAIAVDLLSREILMVAFMDQLALDKTRETDCPFLFAFARQAVDEGRNRVTSCASRKSAWIAIRTRW
jgi:phosphoribosyl-AMP cyclohydrolase